MGLADLAASCLIELFLTACGGDRRLGIDHLQSLAQPVAEGDRGKARDEG